MATGCFQGRKYPHCMCCVQNAGNATQQCLNNFTHQNTRSFYQVCKNRRNLLHTQKNLVNFQKKVAYTLLLFKRIAVNLQSKMR